MAKAPEPIVIEGLREFQRDLKALSQELSKEMRSGLKEVGQIVADEAQSRVPVRSGALKASIKPSATQTQAQVKMGTPKRVPYAGWMDFGGTILFPNRSAGNVSKGRVRTVGGGRTTVVGRNVGAGRAFVKTNRGAVTAERKFVRDGRWFFPSFYAHRPTRNRVHTALERLMETVTRRSGLYEGQ